MATIDDILKNSNPSDDYARNPIHLPSKGLEGEVVIRAMSFQRADRKVVTMEVNSITVKYDGKDYEATLNRKNMSGDGYLHWQNTHQKEIAYAKAMCYAQHIQTFGDLNQVKPELKEIVSEPIVIEEDNTDWEELSKDFEF